MKNINDRGIIKWQPFNSCFDNKDILNEINIERNRQSLPVLSEDQINLIENKIIKAWQLQLIIDVKYYYDGVFRTYHGKIKLIKLQNKIICLNNNLNLYFFQIIDINI